MKRIAKAKWWDAHEVDCEFLGRHKNKDLYICPGFLGPTVVIRHSNRDSDYDSTPCRSPGLRSPRCSALYGAETCEAVRRWDRKRGR